MIAELVTDRWTKPGPGTWTYDGAHGTGAVTPIVQGIFPGAMADGFRSFTGRYGLPISHIEVRYVNDYPYGAVRLAGIPPSDRPAPPAWVLRVLTRLHPEMRRRNRRALDALERRLWRDDLRQWFDELKPARVAAQRALQDVDPTALDDAALAEHVATCAAAFGDGLREHFSLIGASTIPIGLHVLRELERGRTAAAALADLGGAAAGSTGATVPALAAVAAALAEAGVVPVTLDDVTAASPAAAAALDAYLADYGQRVIGAFDLTGRRLIEMPDLIVRSIRAAGARPSIVADAARTDDPVLADARLAVSSRDDHSGICCSWSMGLLRRAVLVAGQRLHAAGRVADPHDAIDASLAEVTSLLRGEPGPTAAALAERAARRRANGLAASPPPPVLGRPETPPDPAVFPSGLRQLTAAMGVYLAAMSSERPDPAVPADAPTGIGLGDAPYRGRAIVAIEPEDAIERLEDGDVLVTTTTTPAFNTVLPIAGALVTAHGGLMSHAGLVARELGIPAVLGLAGVVERIPDGATVEVDPVAGRVTVVAPVVTTD